MRALEARLRRVAFPAAILIFLISAVLAVVAGTRTALTGLGVAAAALAAALWLATRALIISANAQRATLERVELELRRSSGGAAADQLTASAERFASSLRDLPVVVQQSVLVTEAVHRFERSIGALEAQVDALGPGGRDGAGA